MSNHGYVRTKLPMTKADLIAIVTELNTSHFHNNLTIVTEPRSKYIEVHYKGNYCRMFWLNRKNSFEISHQGPGDIGWWVGTVISHTVAKRFNGYITDDGYDGKEQPAPEKYPTYERFLEVLYGADWKKSIHAKTAKLILAQE